MIGEIIDIKDAASEIKRFDIKLDADIKYVPGQYLMLAFEERSKFRRAYSIGMYDSKSRTVSLLIKFAGEFTEKIFSAKINDRLFVYGPYGKFTVKDNHKIVFISGGMGVVPLYNMFLSALHLKDSDLYFFYSCKYYKEMALYDELNELSQIKKHAHVKLYFTREGNMDRFNVEEVKAIKDFSEYDFYVCGPKSMMESVAEQLKSLGVKENKIRTESYRL